MAMAMAVFRREGRRLLPSIAARPIAAIRSPLSSDHQAQALRSGVAAATRSSSQLDFGFPFLLEACWMSTRREIIVTTSLSEEIAQHTLDEIEKRVEVGISPKTKEEAKQVISSLTTCLEENKVLLKDAAVVLAELRASMSQPDEYVTMEKIRNATKVLRRL